jgi:hypothetical protein
MIAARNLTARSLDAYIVIGNPNTRKSSLVRSLTGCFNRSVRDIAPDSGRAALRVYARVGALQETRTGIDDFILEAGRTRCSTVLCCLWPSAHPVVPEACPDALAYLAGFKAAGWRIVAIAALGQNSGGVRGPAWRPFPQAPTDPINVTARSVRAFFGWA